MKNFEQLISSALDGDKNSLVAFCEALPESLSLGAFCEALAESLDEVESSNKLKVDMKSTKKKLKEIIESDNSSKKGVALFLLAFLLECEVSSKRNMQIIKAYYDEAIEDFNHAESMLRRAAIYRIRLRIEKAIPLYQKIIKLRDGEVHPTTKAEAYVELGKIYQGNYELQNLDLALNYFQEAGKLGHPHAHRLVEYNLNTQRPPKESSQKNNAKGLAYNVRNKRIEKQSFFSPEQKVDCSAIKKATEDYLDWMHKNTKGVRFLTRFSHFSHGSRGIKRANHILALIENNSENLNQELQNVYRKSGRTKHAYRRYLFDAVCFHSEQKTVGELSDKEFKKLEKRSLSGLNEAMQAHLNVY